MILLQSSQFSFSTSTFFRLLRISNIPTPRIGAQSREASEGSPLRGMEVLTRELRGIRYPRPLPRVHPALHPQTLDSPLVLSPHTHPIDAANRTEPSISSLLTLLKLNNEYTRHPTGLAPTPSPPSPPQHSSVRPPRCRDPALGPHCSDDGCGDREWGHHRRARGRAQWRRERGEGTGSDKEHARVWVSVPGPGVRDHGE